MRSKLANNLTYLVLFLLPWQTRWIFSEQLLAGEVWEYGKLSLYAVEVLILVLIALRGRGRLHPAAARPLKYGLVFLILSALSAIFSRQQFVSLVAVMHLFFAFAFFILLLDERLSTRKCVSSFLFGLVPAALLGWFQVLTGTSPAVTELGLARHLAATPGDSVVEMSGQRLLRAYGPLSHPNVFGGFLAVGMMLFVWQAKQKIKKIDLSWFLPMSVLLSSTLIITFSRSAWLALTVAFVVLIGLMLWAGKKPPRQAFPILALALIAVSITMVFFQDAMFTRFHASDRLEEKSIAERQSEYGLVGDVIMADPIIGAGIGAYTVSLQEQNPDRPVWSYQPIHNVFLLILAEVGLLGFLAFVLWFTSIDSINYKVAKTSNGIFAMSLGTVLLVIALLDHYLWSSWSGLALAMFSFAVMLRWSVEAKR